MQSEFWHEKWQKQEIGFHLDEVNKVLLKYWPTLNARPGQTVLVPLCGKSLDVVWLRQQGLTVIGVELSELAIAELADTISTELQLPVEREQQEQAVVYRMPGVTLIAADFFDLSPMAHVDWVYDRAALVALPEAMRRDYARQLRAVSGCAPQLLVTLDYHQPSMSGPPFALSDEEVQQHYSSHYHIEVLESRELIEQEPRFRERGLDSFIQRTYKLLPR
ncbi:thiopurine S-methyltransferase [Bacterioplanes sanyensis]|uniref:Thiopurine S-methyltransferase n=1 Tax=Bacterioplanes sanyensis TaxID=1249553 RepID=A0A222FKV2_9GAMM|nr:thiopurine S-methyltransferase [Bacterioplanes sanyensis]ASP39154.1 thiopurine S-methyltransferase [Bacterioplanes sanyensis]